MMAAQAPAPVHLRLHSSSSPALLGSNDDTPLHGLEQDQRQGCTGGYFLDWALAAKTVNALTCEVYVESCHEDAGPARRVAGACLIVTARAFTPQHRA